MQLLDFCLLILFSKSILFGIIEKQESRCEVRSFLGLSEEIFLKRKKKGRKNDN